MQARARDPCRRQTINPCQLLEDSAGKSLSGVIAAAQHVAPFSATKKRPSNAIVAACSEPLLLLCLAAALVACNLAAFLHPCPCSFAMHATMRRTHTGDIFPTSNLTPWKRC